MIYTGNHNGDAYIYEDCPSLTSVGGFADIDADCRIASILAHARMKGTE